VTPDPKWEVRQQEILTPLIQWEVPPEALGVLPTLRPHGVYFRILLGGTVCCGQWVSSGAWRKMSEGCSP
jgi:hypothetical protein